MGVFRLRREAAKIIANVTHNQEEAMALSHATTIRWIQVVVATP